ncbi:MAG: hypothetical protein HYZ17_08225 [Betaproteobacteria bacterium]|nr:hypothetical protein [Betaproteobacteria bacterium]
MKISLLAGVALAVLSGFALGEPVAQNQPLQGFVEVDPTERFIKVVLDPGTPQAKHFIVQDGRMNSLTTDRGRIVFIAKVEPKSGSLRYHPVEARWIEREGKRVQMLYVGPPVYPDSSIEELARAGLTGLQLALSERPAPRR